MAGRMKLKGRTPVTNKNKKRELTKKYNNLFKASLKRKKQNPQKQYFCDKYPSVASFLSIITIKPPSASK